MMHITFTNEAVEQIKKKMPPDACELKLVYDSEGCGCAVSGVPTLWIVNQAGDKDLRAEGDPFELLYEKKHEVYFEDKMTLDFETERNNFVLKSSGQIYNATMRLIDKRE